VAASNQKRVAVVGSGIAGLTAAYLLSRKHHVTLFEREELLGMDAHSRDAYGARMDIPLRVFSESYYPNLCRLYQLLGIRYHPADYSFSCAHGAADGTAVGGRRAYFRYTNLLLRGMAIPLPSVGLLLSPHRLIKYLRLAHQFMRFLRRSPSQILSSGMQDQTLDAFLSACDYSADFGPELLYPMLSVVCTCSYAAVKTYPAALIVDYFADKYGLSGAQCRAHAGTREVVTKLSSGVHRCLTGAAVTQVQAGPHGARVTWQPTSSQLASSQLASSQLASSQLASSQLASSQLASSQPRSEEFDEVVLATQANVSSRILRTECSATVAALNVFEYETHRVVLHTDERLMPAVQSDWSPLNIQTSPGASGAASVTVWMNRIDAHLRAALTRPVFQTWNPATEPAPGTIEADFHFERPVVTVTSAAAMRTLCRVQGRGHVWLVGAYVRYSMPLLENGVISAIEVSKALGVDASDVEFDPEAHSPGHLGTLGGCPTKAPLNAPGSPTHLGWALLAMGVATGMMAFAVRR